MSFPPSRLAWRRSTRLWVLAALLAAATIFSTVVMVHDNSQQRLAVRLAAGAAAERVATHAGTVLEMLALATFAPAEPWARPAEGTGDMAERLLRWQQEAVRCRCREVLAAAAFFQFDPGTGALRLAAAPRAGGPELPDTAVLRQVAAAEVAPGAGRRRRRAHFVAVPALAPWAAVMVPQPDASGAVTAVYGLVAEAGPTLRSLFGPHDAEHAEAMAGQYPELDSLSVMIGRGDSTPLLGRLGAGRTTVTIRPRGPLEGLTLTAALTGAHVLSVRADGPRRRQFWSLGGLFLSTLVTAGFAIGSLRREAQLAQARSDFIAGVSHDLRMPLAQVLLASETLAQGRARDDGERASLLTSILRESRRLVALVDNVLFVSRTGQVALRPERVPVEIPALLADVVEAVELAVEDAGQQVTADPGDAPAAQGDPRLLRQAMVNLVDNAIRYGHPGQRIQLRAERHGNAVRLSVVDEGPGIPAGLRERVFEPYERLPRDQASERTGTGLGLAVVRQIAEACGGRAWIEAAPAGGTAAMLEVPVHPAAS